jgi:hypothetical protein
MVLVMSDEAGSSSTDSDTAEERRTLDVVYTESDRYFKFPVSGVRGGIQSRGDFKMDLFTESLGDPEGERYEVLDDGRLEPVEEPDESRLIREKQATALLSPNIALNISAWILSSITDQPIEEVSQTLEETFGQPETDNGPAADDIA